MTVGEGSSITGASQEDEWGDDMIEDIDLEKASISESVSEKSPRGRRVDGRVEASKRRVTEDHLTTKLREVKKCSYMTMCQTLESRDVVSMVDQIGGVNRRG